MKNLTREELKNVKGGLQDPPAGCFCFTPVDSGGPGLPGGGLSPDCYFGDNTDLYCPAGEYLACC